MPSKYARDPPPGPVLMLDRSSALQMTYFGLRRLVAELPFHTRKPAPRISTIHLDNFGWGHPKSFAYPLPRQRCSPRCLRINEAAVAQNVALGLYFMSELMPFPESGSEDDLSLTPLMIFDTISAILRLACSEGPRKMLPLVKDHGSP